MSRKRERTTVAHSVGGPSTARGHDYQIQYAVYQALDLIVRHYGAPHKATRIALEPRTVHSASGTAIGWDIKTEPEPVVWEAKLNATKQDVVQWMEQVRDADPGERQFQFGFVYGQARTPLVAGLARLRQVAVECADDDTKFNALTADSDQMEAVRSILGSGYRSTLQRLLFVHVPEGLLDNQIRDRARYLVAEDADRLIAFLFKLFSEAAAGRRQYEIGELIEFIHGQSIGPIAPPGRAFADVPEAAQKALILLAACPSGLPKPALAFALQLNEPELASELRQFIDQKLVIEDRAILRFIGWQTIHPEDQLDLLVTCWMRCFPGLQIMRQRNLPGLWRVAPSTLLESR